MVRRIRAGLTGLAHRRLPRPPARLRRGPLRAGAFPSRLRSPRLTSQLGVALGVAFSVCFTTGLLSHLIQHPPSWFSWPSRPVGLYRVTQGVHVATGLATFALLSVKIWSVMPKLFTWPPARDIAHLLDRLTAGVLTAAALFQLVTGLLNIAAWYRPMPFAFIAAHYWTAWVTIGALLVHVAVKLPIVWGSLRRRPHREHADPREQGGARPGREHADSPERGRARPGGEAPADGLSRRGLLATAGATAAAVTLSTVGETVAPLRHISVLAPRVPDLGPQGLPVNTSAHVAGVADLITATDYRLALAGPGGRVELSLAQLRALRQTTVRLPITCVEGWSADGVWTGVRLRELIAIVGVTDPRVPVRVESLQHGSAYSSSIVDSSHTADPLTLLALGLNGAALHPDHGYPCRLIAPDRPGVLQTKWVAAVTVLRP
jgi:DMSO/TMAO reductase YedYZ molybdopterin-dependent catalytic subunit